MHEVEGGGAREGRFARRDFLKLSGAGLAGLAAAPLSACQSSTSGAGGTNGQVRFLIAENFWSDWEPYQSTAQSQGRIERHIFDYLVDFSSGDLSRPEPSLATSWEQRSERTWEFMLRKGVKFHNGQEFTAADVKASIERASGATDVETITGDQYWVPTTVEIVDDYRVRMTTERPFAPLLNQLTDTAIYSAEDLGGDPAKLKRSPNGTGPFRLAEQTSTKKTMEVNGRYWRDPPRIKTLIWEFVKSPQTRLNALVSGQVEAIDRVPPEHLQTISNNSDLRLASTTGIENVNLWVIPGRMELWDNSRAFREAVNWTIDRSALVQNLVKGNSAEATSFMPRPIKDFHQDQSPRYAFDPQRAKSLLREAGVPDGGPEFELWVATGFLPRAEEVVESIANNMRQVGLKPKIVTSDVSGLVDDTAAENGSGDLYHLSWSGNGDPHQSMQAYGTAYKWSTDKQLDKLLERGLTTIDEKARKQAYAELQQYMWQEVPHVPLYNSDFSIAHTAALRGLRVLPNFTTNFYPAQLSGQ